MCVDVFEKFWNLLLECELNGEHLEYCKSRFWMMLGFIGRTWDEFLIHSSLLGSYGVIKIKFWYENRVQPISDIQQVLNLEQPIQLQAKLRTVSVVLGTISLTTANSH